MNIQSNTVITDLIFLDEIRVNGTEITLVRDDLNYTYTTEQIANLREALNAAIQAAGGETPSLNPTGLWSREWSRDQIPMSVRTVWDKDGDPWTREEGETWTEKIDQESNRYAPFRAEK